MNRLQTYYILTLFNIRILLISDLHEQRYSFILYIQRDFKIACLMMADMKWPGLSLQSTDVLSRSWLDDEACCECTLSHQCVRLANKCYSTWIQIGSLV